MQSLKTKNKIELSTALLWGLMFGFWAVIAYFSPMTQDDTQFWANRIVGFKPVFNHAFSYGNGRLLGNMGVYFLLEYRWLKVLVKAVMLTGLCGLLPVALGLKGKTYTVASFLLISLCAPKMFAQVITWTSGFHNFVPCLTLFLAVVCLCKIKKHGLLMCLPIFILSVAMQLYVEHSSVVNLLGAMALCIYAFKADKEMLPKAAAFALGCAVGLVLMLMIPEIAPVHHVDVSNWKTSTLSLGVVGIVVTAAKQSLVLLARFTENVALITCLSVCACMLLNKQADKLKKNEKNILFGALLLPCAFADLAQLNSMGDIFGDAAIFETLFLAALCGIWLLALCYSLVRLALIMKKSEMQLALVLLLFGLISAGPMLLITPMPIRMAFHCYVFFGALLLVLMKELLEEGHPELCSKMLLLVALISSVWLMVHFADLNRITNMREQYIENSVNAGQTSVEYFMHPSDYVFYYYTDEIYSWYYDTLYEVDVKLDLVAHQCWMEVNK